MTENYRGRFAPSPTGLLHFGSLVAAVASFADARHHQGSWLLRIDDIDETRCSIEHEHAIVSSLQTFGMAWDSPVLRQSERTSRYQEIFAELRSAGSVFPCTCSRKKILASARIGIDGPVYPGTCRTRPASTVDETVAWRLRVNNQTIGFTDRLAGPHQQNLAESVGDFVVRRSDGFTAYQLAVVIDDFDQRITDVVRGADLLSSTPRQIWIQRQVGWPTPRYAHLPLVYGNDGKKLSKRDQAHPVDDSDPLTALAAAWKFLRQKPPPRDIGSVNEFWQWAIPQWHIARIGHATER